MKSPPLFNFLLRVAYIVFNVPTAGLYNGLQPGTGVQVE